MDGSREGRTLGWRKAPRFETKIREGDEVVFGEIGKLIDRRMGF